MAIIFIGSTLNPNIMANQEETNIQTEKIINVPYINQDEIVSGCEAVSATMLLQYYGYEITAKDFTDQFLIKKDWYITKNKNKIIYGPDPNSAYSGNPYKKSGENCGFGCYAPALTKSLNKALDKQTHEAIVTTGTSLNDILENYVNKDIPVIIWATMDMKRAKKGMSWTINYTDENSVYNKGDKFTWVSGEHCLVLVGYDEDNYRFNDPYKNHGLISYKKNIVEKRFTELGNQSVAILKK